MLFVGQPRQTLYVLRATAASNLQLHYQQLTTALELRDWLAPTSGLHLEDLPELPALCAPRA